MRRLLKALAVVLLLAGYAVGALATYGARQVGWLTEKAQATPQTLRVADLIAQGPGDNLHVELTDLAFGKPVVVDDGVLGKITWVPIAAAGDTESSPPVVILRTRLARDQAQLDELLRRTSLPVLVTTPLPEGSLWKVRAGDSPRRAGPRIDPGRVTFVTDPVLEVGGFTLLSADVLLEPSTVGTARTVAGGAFTVGTFCLLVLFWGRRRCVPDAPRQAVPPPDLSDHARLTDETPLSVHHFSWSLLVRSQGSRLAGAAFCGGAALIGLAAIVRLLLKGEVTAAGVWGLVTLFIAVTGLRLACAAPGVLLRGAFAVAVFPGGLRWWRGRQTYTALWPDIASVWHYDPSVNGQSKRPDRVLTLILHGGRRLAFSEDTLTDYDAFAATVLNVHGELMLEVKRQELADYREARFGSAIALRPDGVAVWGQFLPWAKLERLEVANGKLMLFRRRSLLQRCVDVPVDGIPNAAVLFTLLREHVMCYF
jgi:hypothetical protein